MLISFFLCTRHCIYFKNKFFLFFYNNIFTSFLLFNSFERFTSFSIIFRNIYILLFILILIFIIIPIKTILFSPFKFNFLIFVRGIISNTDKSLFLFLCKILYFLYHIFSLSIIWIFFDIYTYIWHPDQVWWISGNVIYGNPPQHHTF